MRKRHHPTLTQIVLEMVKEQTSIAGFASEYAMHPTQLHRWRTQSWRTCPELFVRGDDVVAVKAE